MFELLKINLFYLQNFAQENETITIIANNYDLVLANI